MVKALLSQSTQVKFWDRDQASVIRTNEGGFAQELAATTSQRLPPTRNLAWSLAKEHDSSQELSQASRLKGWGDVTFMGQSMILIASLPPSPFSRSLSLSLSFFGIKLPRSYGWR